MCFHNVGPCQNAEKQELECQELNGNFVTKRDTGVNEGESWKESNLCIYYLVELCQFSSPSLCDPMDCHTPGFPVHHQCLALTQTHVHWVDDVIQLSHPLSSPSPPTFNLSQHQGLFQWVNSSHQVAKVLEFQLQHQSFQWIFRTYK